MKDPIRIYIAAPYVRREEARTLRRTLENHGFYVTARWLTVGDQLDDAGARKDLVDIDDSDVLVAYGPEEWRHEGSGGRHAEVGYALAKGKRVILYGARTMIFHYLNDVQVVTTYEELLELLSSPVATAPTPA